MSQISKDTATKMALQLTAKNKEAVDAIYSEFQKLILAAYKATIPKSVTECWKKNKEYFKMNNSIQLNTDGSYWRSHSVTESVIANDGSYIKLHDEKATEAARLILAKHEKAQKIYKQLFEEVEAALLTLRTPKRIEEQFPEAKQFLPNPPSHAIVVNLDKIRKEISPAKNAVK